MKKPCEFAGEIKTNFSLPLGLPKSGTILRSNDDFQEMKYSLIKNGMKDFKHHFLASYNNTDFTKESLIILHYLTSRSYSHQLVSCSTRFDANGKLYCTVNVLYKRFPNEWILPDAVDQNVVILKLKKKDEAMIDYFQLTSESGAIYF